MLKNFVIINFLLNFALEIKINVKIWKITKS